MFEYKYYIVRDDMKLEDPLEKLEEHFKKGWEPVSECPMPSHGNDFTVHPPTCLVLLRREKGCTDENKDVDCRDALRVTLTNGMFR